MINILITPVLKAFKSSLDAKNDILIEFYSRGGDQVAKNEVEIYETETNTMVYQKVVSSFNSKHTVIANTLTNGNRYKVRIRTYNIDGLTSNWSEYLNFKCSSTPVIILNEIANGTVNNQTYTFSGTYSQAEDEPIQSYRFILYDRYRNQISASDEIYSKTIQYEFTGFNNDENYYIEIKIKSSGSVEATTGLIEFYVKYIQPRMRTVLKLENNKEKATVSIEANPIQVIFKSVNDTYVYGDNCVNLSTDKIYTDKTLGFTLDADKWTINLRFKLYDTTKNIMTLESMLGDKIAVYRNIDRIFIEYWYGDILMITRLHDISDVTLDTELNLYLQKNKGDFLTKLII